MFIPIRGARLRRLALTTTIAIAGLTSAAGAAHAKAKTEPATPAPKPTVLLDHAAWADGSGWNRV